MNKENAVSLLKTLAQRSKSIVKTMLGLAAAAVAKHIAVLIENKVKAKSTDIKESFTNDQSRKENTQ